MNEDKTPKYKQAPIDINLPTLPLYRIEEKEKDLEAWESKDKEIKIVFADGRPSTEMQKYLVYLSSKISRKAKGEVDIENKPIGFTLSELCEFSGKRDNTINRRTIKNDLSKLNSIVLRYVKRFLVEREDGEKAKYKTVEFIQPFKIILFDDEKKDEQLGLWENQIIFHELIQDNLKNKIYRLVDTNKVREIKNPTATRIYLILSMHNHSKDKQWQIGLIKLAEQVPIQTTIIRNTRQVIKKALEELKKKSAIHTYRISIRDIITITFEPQDYEDKKNLFLSGMY